jgi:hypothetical protein
MKVLTKSANLSLGFISLSRGCPNLQSLTEALVLDGRHHGLVPITKNHIAWILAAPPQVLLEFLESWRPVQALMILWQ